MITGDEKGKIRLYDLTQLLKYFNLTPTPDYEKQRKHFNPKRKEDIDATL